MDPILSSNQSSAVVATVLESEVENPFIYQETGRMIAPHSMKIATVTSSSGSVGVNKTLSFELPKQGLVLGVWANLTLPANSSSGSETRNPGSSETVDSTASTLATTGNSQGSTAQPPSSP